MSERDDKRGGAGCALGLVLVFMFLPALYVLGIGPAAWLAEIYPATEPPLIILYFPLMLLAESCTPIDVALRCTSSYGAVDVSPPQSRTATTSPWLADEKRGGAEVAIGCLLLLLFGPVLYVL